MEKKTKTLVAVLVLALAIMMALFLHVYIVADGSGGTIFWKGEEAYLFVGGSHLGYKFKVIEYPFVLLGEYFYRVPSPENEVVSMLVIRVTPSGVENNVVNYGKDAFRVPAFLTPFDDSFYAMCPGGILCKWNGKRFEAATQDEERRFGGVERLARGGVTEASGWRARDVVGLPGDHFEVQLGRDLVISLKNRAANPRAYPWASIDLVRPGQAAQSLYNVDGTPRRVSKSEYDSTFKKP